MFIIEHPERQESEENYRFMSKNNIETDVKYNCFQKEQRPKFKPKPFKAENFYYNEEHDHCIFPMEQKMEKTGIGNEQTKSGYIREKARYKVVRCEGCPLRCLCFKAKENRIIEINHKLKIYKQKAKELLTSEERLIKHRG